jgi:hypothetical protein
LLVFADADIVFAMMPLRHTFRLAFIFMPSFFSLLHTVGFLLSPQSFVEAMFHIVCRLSLFLFLIIFSA